MIILFALLYCSVSATAEYYVRPSTTSTSYPACQEPCLTLEDYVRNATEYFTSNTEFIFLEGEHQLNAALMLDNVTNITLRGISPELTATIILLKNSDISYTNSQDIFLSSLQVLFHGEVSNQSSSALIFDQTEFIEINNIQFARLNNSSSYMRALNLILSTAIITNCTFSGGHSTYGGAIYVHSSTINISGINSYTENTADVSGGAIFINDSEITFNGINTFIRNLAITEEIFVTGGNAMFISLTEVHFNDEVEFQENGPTGESFNGVTMLVFDSSITTKGRATFSANHGGAVTLERCNFTATGETNFIDNFRNEGSYGAALYAEYSSISLSGATNFINNTVIEGVGGAVFVFKSNIHLLDLVLFDGNEAETGGAIYLDGSYLTQQFIVTYIRNIGEHRGGAVYSTNSTITVSGISNYIDNVAMSGGGMGLERDSELVLKSPIQMNFYRNKADFGAGMFYADLNAIAQCQNIVLDDQTCFFKVETANSTDMADVHLNFTANLARKAGTILYGGSLQLCQVQVNNQKVEMETFDFIQTIFTVNTREDNSSLSSDALKVCFCFNNTIDCFQRQSSISVRRGQKVTIPVIAVGQFDSPVPSEVRAYIDNNYGFTDFIFRHTFSGTQCSNSTFQVFTEEGNNKTQLVIFPDGPCGNIANARTTVNITIEDCFPGFDLVGRECMCEEKIMKLLSENESLCSVDTGLIQRPNSYTWIKPLWDTNLTNYLGFVWSENCRYCKQEDTSLPTLMNFSNPDSNDDQCSENRTGILCGKCKATHSLTLSTFSCVSCENDFISLLLVFAFAGIALIVVLLALQMTVATGTINGIILYANVINICKDIFFPPLETKVNLLEIFIAWINLDFGISTCFYDGLDDYSYSWLQFVFPLYLWFLIGIIIFINKRSARIGKLFGSNPIAVLATVILMSYTKLLQTSVDILTYIELEYPNGRKIVWLPDPNIPYFGSKHAILSIVAISVIAFLLLPFIFLLLFGYQLQAFSGRKRFFWFNKLKPFLDAYYAPYNKSTRYWPGFMLLVRAGLFLSLLVVQANFRLIAVSSLFTAVAIIPWLSNRLYEKLYVDVLEASFILNLCILTTATYHVQTVNSSQTTLTNVFVGIVFMEFVGIVIYHICLRLKIMEYLRRRKKGKQETDLEMIPPTNTMVSVFALREPLLESL